LKVTALGNDPDSFRAGDGEPVVVTVKFPAVPTVKVVLLALVIDGAPVTVIVRVGGLASVEPRLSVTVKDAT
jgi:hypothetical protein